MNPIQLIRWCDLFVEGGRLRLAGALSARSEADLRFFDLLENECRRTLAVLSERTRDLMHAGPDLPGRGEAWREIASEIDALSAYLDQLTEAVVATRRDLPLDTADVDLPGLLGDVVSSFDDGEVVVEDGHPVRAFTDPEVFQRATRDLVSCALGLAGRRPVQLSVAAQEEFATVELRTQAPSADPHTLRALFEPFGDGGQDGDGRRDVGLFRCRALVVALGGDVGVSGGEEGVTFWLRVPRGPLSDERMETA